ncbi:MAG: O-antigen ligase family protein [Chloroflexi bacterium]|nr:O-antigen ligase family protein [Chloroflexota bacterium]
MRFAIRSSQFANWSEARLALACALGGIAIGALLGYVGPLIAVAVVAALAVAAWAMSNLEVALWGIIAVIILLPFASLPLKIVITPTFLDLAMGGALGVYALQWMTGQRRRLTITPAHAPAIVFIVLALFSFVAGLNNGPLTPNLLRHFAEFILSIGFAFVVVDHVDTPEKLNRLVLVILLCGTLAALLGIFLYVIPDEAATRALNALRVFGYPTGAVLRYIEDDPENAQRAISTSVDPNVLGGLLAMIGALAAPQLFANEPLLGRRLRPAWYAAFGIIAVCLLLTFSRGAMLGLAVGVVGLGVARYRRLLWLALAAALVVALLPATEDYVGHFLEGVRGQDLATQMRFGEYKDALILIGRYPLIGVGFAGAPDLDIYLGVANAYLTIASEMGLVGLTAFVGVFGAIFGWMFASRRKASAPAAIEPLWYGLHAGLVSALVVGLFDHYFFNLDFQPAGTIFWLFAGLALAATRLGRGG